MERKIRLTDTISLLIEIGEESDIGTVAAEGMLIHKIAKAVEGVGEINHKAVGVHSTKDSIIKPYRRIGDDEAQKMVDEYEKADREERKYLRTKYGFSDSKVYSMKIANLKTRQKVANISPKAIVHTEPKIKSNSPWTQEKMSQVQNLSDRGKNAGEIARIVGLDYDQVRHKIKYMRNLGKWK
jgi:hypothetical protein